MVVFVSGFDVLPVGGKVARYEAEGAAAEAEADAHATFVTHHAHHA